jgi:hypothetical protein
LAHKDPKEWQVPKDLKDPVVYPDRKELQVLKDRKELQVLKDPKGLLVIPGHKDLRELLVLKDHRDRHHRWQDQRVQVGPVVVLDRLVVMPLPSLGVHTQHRRPTQSRPVLLLFVPMLLAKVVTLDGYISNLAHTATVVQVVGVPMETLQLHLDRL